MDVGMNQGVLTNLLHCSRPRMVTMTCIDAAAELDVLVVLWRLDRHRLFLSV
jgi:hypothetical protein